MDNEIKIREAAVSDCLSIKSLIQELADFENMSNGPKLDVKVLQEDGFESKKPMFKCYVAVHNNKIIGYALYFNIFFSNNQKEMHLEDLYVTPTYRKKKVGSTLFKTVLDKALEEKCNFIQFSVLSWNPAQNFYKKFNAVDLTEKEGWTMYRFDQNSIQKLNSIYTTNKCICKSYEISKEQNVNLEYIELLNKEMMKNVEKFTVIGNDSFCLERKELHNVSFGYFVAKLNKDIIGYALHSCAYSTWEGKSLYIQEFYVSEEEQYKEHYTNITTQLLLSIANKAYEESYCRIDLWIKDSAIMGKFYVSNGAVNLTEAENWHLYRISL